MTLLSLLMYAAQLIHPGADVRHRDLVEAIARYAADEDEAFDCLVFAEYESRMGEALSGKRFDSRAFGVLQIRDRPWLERDVTASVQTWLRMKRDAAKACGDDGLNAISSGRCDRGTRLADARRQEALWLSAWAHAGHR